MNLLHVSEVWPVVKLIINGFILTYMRITVVFVNRWHQDAEE